MLKRIKLVPFGLTPIYSHLENIGSEVRLSKEKVSSDPTFTF